MFLSLRINLNDDILDRIAQTCPPGSLAAFSLASSYFHSLALPHLLRVVVLNRDPEQLLSFLDFIIKNKTQRSIEDFSAARRVKELVIGGFALFMSFGVVDVRSVSSWAPTLTHALSLMLNLQSFVIKGFVEEISTYSTDFAITLLSRPCLTRIDLNKLGVIASSLFGEAMTSGENIAKLNMVRLVKNDFADGQCTADIGVIRGLFHSMEHLTEIHLYGYDLQNLLTHDNGTLSIFRNVQTLKLWNSWFCIKTLATVFPAVRNLVFTYVSLYPKTSPPNKILFPNLVSVEGKQGGLKSFFNSIGSNHVRRVVVSQVNHSASAFTLTQSLPLLRSLRFNLLTTRPISWWTTLATNLPQLTYFSISTLLPLQHRGPDDSDESEGLLAEIPRSLASVPLVYISLNLTGVTHVKCVGDSDMVTKQAIALIYAQNIPTLEYIDVQKDIKSVEGSVKWWRVVRSSPSSNKEVEVSLKVLEEEEGMALKQWYDLEVWK